MAFQISFFLIFTGLTGIDSLTTVSKVSVKYGQSITIPCLYDAKYKNHVKYLCQGYEWSSCTYAIKTGQPNSQRFSISDDKKQRIFTVTIKQAETGYYWCNVEIDNWGDTGERFHLSVTTGTPSLYVDQQKLTAFEGGSIGIICRHSNSGQNKWCRLGGPCETKSSGWMDGTQVTITSKSNNYFTVEMSGLKTENSGWYLCVRGDHQMPVHLTVNKQSNSTSRTPTKGNELMSAGELHMIIIPLSLLVFLVMTTLLMWFLLRKYKQRRAEATTTTTIEEEVTYSTVDHTSKTTRKVQPKAEDDKVIYSTWAQ
ncbi:uncharacterized protein LOC122884288 isoform X1 [Xyrichtys novacula]|uniref:Uncharacterized protein LOC122884288 isoform X1 n=1 Tax=Xyrichtys novacula TaxID=13765 RepID=A0AAV1G095_XYRNO|nr:uncharacterized protein LOC122884288 isoform X1 [Xyrichtys novacula]